MFAFIHLYLEKDINLTQGKSRVERTVSFSAKQNSLLEKKPHLLSNSARVRQVTESQQGYLWTHTKTNILLKKKLFHFL